MPAVACQGLAEGALAAASVGLVGTVEVLQDALGVAAASGAVGVHWESGRRAGSPVHRNRGRSRRPVWPEAEHQPR